MTRRDGLVSAEDGGRPRNKDRTMKSLSGRHESKTAQNSELRTRVDKTTFASFYDGTDERGEEREGELGQAVANEPECKNEQMSELGPDA